MFYHQLTTRANIDTYLAQGSVHTMYIETFAKKVIYKIWLYLVWRNFQQTHKVLGIHDFELEPSVSGLWMWCRVCFGLRKWPGCAFARSTFQFSRPYYLVHRKWSPHQRGNYGITKMGWIIFWETILIFMHLPFHKRFINHICFMTL